jgi:hypothetical protein
MDETGWPEPFGKEACLILVTRPYSQESRASEEFSASI